MKAKIHFDFMTFPYVIQITSEDWYFAWIYGDRLERVREVIYVYAKGSYIGSLPVRWLTAN